MTSSHGISDEATSTTDGDNRSVPSSTGASTMKRKSLKIPPKNFFGVLYQAMHPDACLRSCHGQTEEDFEQDQLVLDEVLPDVLVCMDSKDEDVRIDALEDLQRLVDKQRAHNRIPVVCTSEWDVIGRLTRCLANPDSSNERRLACLILNDLSIPFDNKAVMVLGEQGDALFKTLLEVIQHGYPEAYLCCSCFMNLSILEGGKRHLMNYEPSKLACQAPLNNTSSLLRVMEQMMTKHAPFLLSPLVSVEGQAVRWAMGMFLNLSTVPENDLLIVQTTVPTLAVQFLQSTPHPLCKWTRDSLEDYCLSLLAKLVRFPGSLKLLKRHHSELGSSLKHLVDEMGIHSMRASLIISRLLEADN